MDGEDLEKFIRFVMDKEYNDYYEVKKVLQSLYDYGYEDGYNDRFIDYETMWWLQQNQDEEWINSHTPETDDENTN